MMKMTDMNHLNRRQDDRQQQPQQLQWETRKRREDDFIPPEQPLDWSDLEPNHHNES